VLGGARVLASAYSLTIATIAACRDCISRRLQRWISFPHRHADRAGIGSYTAPWTYPIALSR